MASAYNYTETYLNFIEKARYKRRAFSFGAILCRVKKMEIYMLVSLLPTICTTKKDTYRQVPS